MRTTLGNSTSRYRDYHLLPGGSPVEAMPLALAVPRKGYERFNPVKRWWKLSVKPGPDACWNWIGARNPLGYGRLKMAGRQVFAHRLAMVIRFGPLQRGECVLHSCDNPSCVNWNHLRIGTRVENGIECGQKGRRARGEQSGQSKLTAQQVQYIRLKYQYRKYGVERLAAECGVHFSTVHKIVKRESWRYL